MNKNLTNDQVKRLIDNFKQNNIEIKVKEPELVLKGIGDFPFFIDSRSLTERANYGYQMYNEVYYYVKE